MRISLNTNLDSIVAGDDISIVIHPDAWEIATTLYYRIETSQPVQHTIASVVSPFNLEYDWTVDVIGNPVVFQVSAFPIFHSAFSDPVLISPSAPEIIAPTDGELTAAGSSYTFRWTQKPPNQFDPIFGQPLRVTTTKTPVLHVGTPAPWHLGEDGTVHWTVAGAVDHFKVELSRNGGQSWTTLADNIAGQQHHFTVGVDPPVSNSCRVRVEAFGPNGTATAMSGTFHIVGGPPPRGGRTPQD